NPHKESDHDLMANRSHVRRPGDPRLPGPGRGPEPAVPQRQLAVADRLRRREPTAERVHPLVPAGDHPAQAGCARRLLKPTRRSRNTAMQLPRLSALLLSTALVSPAAQALDLYEVWRARSEERRVGKETRLRGATAADR